MAETYGLAPWLLQRFQIAQQHMQLLTGGRVDSRSGTVVAGVRPVVTSGYRSYEKQQQLYDARSTNPYPVNKPGDSSHQFGLGVDSDVPDKYMPLWIAVRKYYGFNVPANDEVHAEYPGWRQLVGR